VFSDHLSSASFLLFSEPNPLNTSQYHPISKDNNSPTHLRQLAIMAPSAVTPPPQDVNGLPPTDKLNTTRKIVVFSGEFLLKGSSHYQQHT
jgi:hypothetical protein